MSTSEVEFFSENGRWHQLLLHVTWLLRKLIFSAEAVDSTNRFFALLFLLYSMPCIQMLYHAKKTSYGRLTCLSTEPDPKSRVQRKLSQPLRLNLTYSYRRNFSLYRETLRESVLHGAAGSMVGLGAAVARFEVQGPVLKHTIA